MTGENDHLLFPKGPDQLSDLDNLVRIETTGRLVHDQDPGIMHKRLGYADPLLVALGEVPDVLAQHAAQADHLNDPVDRRPGLGSRHLPDPGDKLEVLNNLHIHIERRALRQVANRLPHLHGVLKSLYVIHIDAAGICHHVGCYNLQGRRLPGSIGPKEAEDLTRSDLKADVVYGDRRSVGLGNILYLNHELISTAPPSASKGLASCSDGFSKSVI